MKSPQDPSAALEKVNDIKKRLQMSKDIDAAFTKSEPQDGDSMSRWYIHDIETLLARIKELERENARMREAVMYAKSMSADADDEEEPNSCLWLINKSMSEVLSFSSHE